MLSSSIPRLNRSPLGRRCCVLGSLSLLWLASACSAKDSITIIEGGPLGEQTANTGSDGQGGSGSAGGGGAAGTASVGSGNAAEGPVYVVFSTIDTPDGRTSYYALSSSIEGDVPVVTTEGLELPGHADLYAPPEGGYILSAADDAPTLTRYKLGEDNQLVEGATLSLANFGLSYSGKVVFINSSKAYVLDNEQVQIISFNPSTMEVIGTVPVNDFECDEVDTYFGFPVVRDDGMYLTRGCWDNTLTSSGSTLVHVNLETDEVTVTQDSRCMGMEVALLADNGDAYWFSDPQASMEWSVSEIDGPRDCGLRVLAGESTFDPNWSLDLTARTGGLSAIASVPASGSTIWVKVFEESAMTETIPVPVDDINWGWPVWRWASIDVASDEPAVPDTDADLVAYYGDAILIDGRSFTPASNLTFTETTLVELTNSGFEKRMTVQGELREIVKLR